MIAQTTEPIERYRKWKPLLIQMNQRSHGTEETMLNEVRVNTHHAPSNLKIRQARGWQRLIFGFAASPYPDCFAVSDQLWFRLSNQRFCEKAIA
jgi:hypothetical protein